MIITFLIRHKKDLFLINFKFSKYLFKMNDFYWSVYIFYAFSSSYLQLAVKRVQINCIKKITSNVLQLYYFNRHNNNNNNFNI